VATLLYVDVLGVKARWISGGKAEAQHVFDSFRTYLMRAISELPQGDLVEGFIESDSAVFVCRTAHVAVTLGVSLYSEVFMQIRPNKDRFWLRGVITPLRDGTELRSERTIGDGAIREFMYSDPLLDAIATEKSGVKGMRLLIKRSLVTKSLRTSFSFQVGNDDFIQFRKLTHSSRPQTLFEKYEDVLWMIDADPAVWRRREMAMASRLRWAVGSEEEFLQAAATQVVFHECSAIRADLERNVH